MKVKIAFWSIVTVGTILVAPVASAGPATVLSASFEVGEVKAWTMLRQYADQVASNTSFFQGSNLDGVNGARFLLFGMGSNPGKIRFSLITIPGKSYALSYFCGGTDTQRIPIGSGPGFQLTFKSSVQAYYGKKIVIDHLGLPIEVDDLESLNSRIHPFSTPGTWNWRIYAWLPVNYSFVAKSSTTWIEFETTTTNGNASVGVLDQVLVTTDPFAEISISGSDVKINFAGKLQESGNLLNWSDVSPQPASPFVFPKSTQPRFFRVEK